MEFAPAWPTTLEDLCPCCGNRLTLDWTGLWCPVCQWCANCEGTGCHLCRDEEAR